MNHSGAFPYKKFFNAAAFMTFILLTLTLGACQKSEPETEKAAAPGSKMVDKVSESTGEGVKAAGEMAEKTSVKAGEAAEAAGEMVEKTKEKAGAAYQKSTAEVKEVVTQGEDAVETANDAVGGALKGVNLPKTE